MWRKLSGSLTLRIFLITAALLAAACALTYAALAYLTPITYTALLEDELDAAASELIARLEQTTQAESAPELARFTQQTGATAQLLLPDEFEAAVTEGTAEGENSEDGDITAAEIEEGEAFASGDVAASGSAEGDAPAIGDLAAADVGAEEQGARAAASSQDDIPDEDNPPVQEAAEGAALASGDVAMSPVGEGDEFASAQIPAKSIAFAEAQEPNAELEGQEPVSDAERREAWFAVSSAEDIPDSGNGAEAETAEGDSLAFANAVAEADAEVDAESNAFAEAQESDAELEEQGTDSDAERRESWFAISSEDDLTQSISVEDGVAEISGVTYVRQEADEAAFAGDVAVARELCYEFAFRDGQRAELVVSSGLRAVNRTTEAMRRVLPYLALALLAFSLVGALVYARFITRPIVDISALAGRIANLDFKARWRGRRRDEIGALGESLNRLSDNLSGALGELQAANDRLRADIERERELERARLAFFSATSHELKTPVTILKGQLSGMLAQVGAYRDREKYLARALEVAKRMEALVQQILTVSRLESAAPVGDDAVDLSALLRRQIEQDAELIEVRGLNLATEIAPNVALRGSEKLLSSALDNVLMNAILYSPPGAQIRVNLTPSFLRVFNAGAHIDEADLPRLFEPFYRAEQSRSRATGGSGLGLYLVQRILELHGVGCAIKNTPDGVEFLAEINPL